MVLNNNYIYDKEKKKYLIDGIGRSQAGIFSEFLLSLSPETTELFHPHSFDKEFLKKILVNKDNIRIVLLKHPQNKIVGYAFINRILPLRNIGYLGIVISEKYQGRGLAYELTGKLLQRAKIEGINDVYLNVYTKNTRAIQLYKKLGFKKIKIVPVLRYVITLNELIRSGELKNVFLNIFNKKTEIKSTSVWMLNKI